MNPDRCPTCNGFGHWRNEFRTRTVREVRTDPGQSNCPIRSPMSHPSHSFLVYRTFTSDMRPGCFVVWLCFWLCCVWFVFFVSCSRILPGSSLLAQDDLYNLCTHGVSTRAKKYCSSHAWSLPFLSYSHNAKALIRAPVQTTCGTGRLQAAQTHKKHFLRQKCCNAHKEKVFAHLLKQLSHVQSVSPNLPLNLNPPQTK